MYERILVPVDGSAASLRGFDGAIRLAKALNATLRIMHMVNDLMIDLGPAPTLTSESLLDALRASGKQVLAGAEEIARRQGARFEVCMLETIGKAPSDVIVEDAKSWPLIVRAPTDGADCAGLRWEVTPKWSCAYPPSSAADP